MTDLPGAANKHITVLLNEAVEMLVTNKSGLYVDGTFGRGGHSRLILSQLESTGRLIGIDKDPQAISEGEKLATEDSRFQVFHAASRDIETVVFRSGLGSALDGVLLDLGVSSPQLDDASRGFSFSGDGPLDMRMDTTKGQTASEWLYEASEEEIALVLKKYGEEKFSRRMARAIRLAQESGPIETTGRLAKIVADANPAWEKGKNPATRAFQAIRIKINGELEELEDTLEQASRLLKVGGRLVVISFHSLEDRLVKQFMRQKVKGNEPPPGVPIRDDEIAKHFRLVGKAIKPSKQEVEMNVRSRSAVMRVLEKIDA